MKILIKHRVTQEDLTDVLHGKLRISDKVLSQLKFSQYQDCLIKILIPGVSSEIYSLIENCYLKIYEIEGSFFQSLGEDEMIYIELNMFVISGESSYRLDFSRTDDFTDLLINNPPQVSKEVISYLTQSFDNYKSSVS